VGLQNGTIVGTNPLTANLSFGILNGTLNAPVVLPSGSVMVVEGGTFTLTPAGTISGAANVTFSYGVAQNVNGTYNVSGQTIINGGYPGPNFNGPTTMGSLVMSYPLGGTGNVTITGSFGWAGDELRGSGTV